MDRESNPRLRQTRTKAETQRVLIYVVVAYDRPCARQMEKGETACYLRRHEASL